MIAFGLLYATFALVIVSFSESIMDMCLLKEVIQETSFMRHTR